MTDLRKIAAIKKVVPKKKEPLSQAEQMRRNLINNRNKGKYSNGVGVGY